MFETLTMKKVLLICLLFVFSCSKEEPRVYTLFVTSSIGGTVSTSIFVMMQGVQMIRVHDVNEINHSIKVFKELIK